ncbi:hypothetical protein KDA00_04415 [Candidatus Saccharibacteria bacterium]|nr:hypothetical protein [Candidatus Saccharibacteria bacterium]
MQEEQNVSIHTGFPNPATDRHIASLSLDKLLVKHAVSTFMMRIEGNLWEERGVFNNDLVIIDRSLKGKNNDLIVWWEGESFQLSLLQNAPMDMVVWGVVTAVIHRYRV